MDLSIAFTDFKSHLNVKTEEGKRFIFCAIRKKYLVLTPEEMVRQLVLHYLIEQENINKNWINVEKMILVNERRKRFDILIYQEGLYPQMIVECKAPNISISQATFEQISTYNLTLKAPYLFVTNGLTSYCAKIDFTTQSFNFLERFPNLY